MRFVTGLTNGVEDRLLVVLIHGNHGRADLHLFGPRAGDAFQGFAHTGDAGLAMHSVDGDGHTLMMPETMLTLQGQRRKAARHPLQRDDPVIDAARPQLLADPFHGVEAVLGQEREDGIKALL